MKQAIKPGNMTLNQVLKQLGFTTAKSSFPGKKLIRNAQGKAIGHMNAGDTWGFLEWHGLIVLSPGGREVSYRKYEQS